jgi:hypothetical protein
MPAYDSEQFNPPAPLARVAVCTRDHATTVSDLPMLTDSGADVTLIPRSCADPLGPQGEPYEGFALRGFDGSTSVAKSIDAEMLFLEYTFRGQFLLIEDECGVLGRNVLNHLSLMLDGPRLTWTVQGD